jgi:cytochrome c551/c552
MRKLLLLLGLVLAFALAACGGDSAPAPSGSEGEAAGAGDVAAGEALFKQSLIGAQAGCATCHSLEPGVTMVGPSLATIGADAGGSVSGVSAEDYLRKSIADPNADIADGFSAGLMPAALADELTEEQVNDLIAYLLTLK